MTGETYFYCESDCALVQVARDSEDIKKLPGCGSGQLALDVPA